MLQLAMIGTIVVQLPQPAVAPYHFKAQYKLKMGGGSGADGMSFSYGDLAAGEGVEHLRMDTFPRDDLYFVLQLGALWL